MYAVVLNATHSRSHTSVPSCRVSVRPVLLVVAGITSQGLHSLTEVTHSGWFACKSERWWDLRASSCLFFLINLPSTPRAGGTDILAPESSRLLILSFIFFPPSMSHSIMWWRWRQLKSNYHVSENSLCVWTQQYTSSCSVLNVISDDEEETSYALIIKKTTNIIFNNQFLLNCVIFIKNS